jgi:mono/diheme cytochrome c family protein
VGTLSRGTVAAGAGQARVARRRLRGGGDRPFCVVNRYLHALMLIALIIIWVLLGLGVFFVAMRGGPAGARASLHTQSKPGQRAVTLGIVVLIAFGLAVPAIVLAFNAEHKASVGVGGVHLGAEEQKGRDLFARACAVCHTLAAVKSVGRIGPNLDVRVGDDIATSTGRKALVLSAILEGRARGLGQMPALLYQGKEAEEVSSFVAAVAGH